MRQREKRDAGRERWRPEWVLGSGCGGQTDYDLMMAEWDPQLCVSAETTGELATATSAPDEWRCTMQSYEQ